jgi:diguanylate cyclase (GGDEF)-like protein
MFNDVFNRHSILSLFYDSNGQLWIGSYTGLFRLNKNRLTQLSPQKGLQDKAIYVIKEDSEGVIWMGSDAGLVKYVPSPFVGYSMRNGLVHDFIRAIDIGPDGRIWLGTREGVSILDPVSQQLTNIKQQLGPGLWRIYALIVLDNDEALLGSQVGLVHWRQGQIVKVYRNENTDDPLPASYVSAFTRDKQGRVWIGSRRGLALWDNNQLHRVKSSSFNFGGIFALESDSQGRLWIGSASLGLVIYDPNTETYFQPNSINKAMGLNVWHMARDRNGNIWVGTNGNGLIAYNEQFEEKYHFNRDQGLKDDFVWQVLADSQNNIWAFTNTGLKKFNGTYFIHYDGGDGLLDLEGAATAVAEHPSHDIWFGTAYGVMRYHPDASVPALEAPPILIESVWQGLRPNNYSQKLQFNEGAVTIKFASLSFRDERDIKFIYRLQGASSDWSLPIKENLVHFANLSAGHYTFEVKAINGNHISSPEAARVSFVIIPPFWKQPWFLIFSTLVFLLILYLSFQLRLKRVEREKRKLEQLVAERTATIEQVNQTLKQLVITDELTQLFNRRYLMETLESGLQQLSRAPKTNYLSLILLDVDHFKEVNDNFGHLAGDQVLKEIASRLKKLIRKSDIAARYGGEEFAILLPHTDNTGARHIAEKIKEAISQDKITLPKGEAIQVTVSLGVTTVSQPQVQKALLTPSQLLSQADQALYKAKEQGRHRVINYLSLS